MFVSRSAEVAGRFIEKIEGLRVRGDVNVKPMMDGDQMIMLEIHYAVGAGTPLHIHQHESLCYIVEGKANMVVGDRSYVVNKGDACRHPEGVPHSVHAIEETTILEIKSPAPVITKTVSQPISNDSITICIWTVSIIN